MTDQRSCAQYTGSPATLADHEREDFRLKPTCRKCWHAGEAMTPAEVAKRFGVPMTTPHPEIERRLVCAKCGARAGFLQIENPAVTRRR